MSIDVERWLHFNLWKCPRDRIDYRRCSRYPWTWGLVGGSSPLVRLNR